jgi:uncharacterized membrane protein YsdA (DUF1294 family)
MTMLFLLAPIYLAFINLVVVAAFKSDKAKAVAGERRTPESELLFLAAIGGMPGALWARQRFRHKTRKQPFSSQLELIAMVETGVIAGLAFFWVSG